MTTPVDPRIDTFRDILGAVERHPELWGEGGVRATGGAAGSDGG